jgi:hypothetical protein
MASIQDDVEEACIPLNCDFQLPEVDVFLFQFRDAVAKPIYFLLWGWPWRAGRIGNRQHGSKTANVKHKL